MKLRWIVSAAIVILVAMCVRLWRPGERAPAALAPRVEDDAGRVLKTPGQASSVERPSLSAAPLSAGVPSAGPAPEHNHYAGLPDGASVEIDDMIDNLQKNDMTAILKKYGGTDPEGQARTARILSSQGSNLLVVLESLKTLKATKIRGDDADQDQNAYLEYGFSVDDPIKGNKETLRIIRQGGEWFIFLTILEAWDTEEKQPNVKIVIE